MQFTTTASHVAIPGATMAATTERPIVRWLRSWASVALANVWNFLAGPVR